MTGDGESLADTTAGLTIALMAIVHFYEQRGGPKAADVARHLQSTADSLPPSTANETRRVLERIADGLMHAVARSTRGSQPPPESS